MGEIDQMRKGTTTIAILKLLVDRGEPMYGYEIIRQLERRSEGYFRFPEGLIYPRLHQMEQEGLVCSQWWGEPGTRRRKYYAVTDRGHRRLEEELQHWRTFSGRLNQLLGLQEAHA